MRLTSLAPLAVATLLATPALAAPDDSPRITGSATGSVRTPPDRATIAYPVRGEGASSDEAVGALVVSRNRVEAGLAVLAQPVSIHAGKVVIQEVRDPPMQVRR